jgi:hypothetical protein
MTPDYKVQETFLRYAIEEKQRSMFGLGVKALENEKPAKELRWFMLAFSSLMPTFFRATGFQLPIYQITKFPSLPLPPDAILRVFHHDAGIGELFADGV